jgi:putative spermidine/putrescine transport system ATP-binding protein
MAFLEMSSLEKYFGASHVVRDFNMNVESGEFISFLGPSGCGKTTTLRMIAGFEQPTSGSIAIAGEDVVNKRPNQRNIGMVFQSYALFPNMTAAQNVGFGLRVARTPRQEAQRRIGEMLALVGLKDFGERYPFQLSGGQQQRVALARALAIKPQVLLLDEPLSALDAKIRVSLREEIRNIQRDLGITTIYVTHDQEEALSMSDRIVVMNNGRAEQIGEPFEIYNHPSTAFVANFVGTLSTLHARVKDPAAGIVEIGGQDLSLGRPLDRNSGDEIDIGLRPETVAIGQRPDHNVSLRARIQEVSFLGSVVRIRVAVGESSISVDTFNTATAHPPVIGSDCDISFSTDSLVLW